MPFRETQPPELQPFLALNQQNKTTNIDYSSHLISHTESPEYTDISYLLFTAKQGFVSLLTLELGCLLSKNNIEILYAYNAKITAIVLVTVRDGEGGRLGKGVYAMIGFQDGTIGMYLVMETGNHPLVQIFKIRPKLDKKEPVINFHIWKCNLLVTTAYHLFLYPKIFQKDSSYSLSSPKKPPSQPPTPKPLKTDLNSYKLNTQLNPQCNQLYIYNEYEGAVCLDLETMHEDKRVQDCIKVLRVWPGTGTGTGPGEQVVVLGGSDDTVKFVDYWRGVIQRFVGVKNYVVAMEEDKANGMLWVGDLEGSITCFSYQKDQIPKEKAQGQKQSFVMHETRLKLSRKVVENGIKKLIVHKNLLVILDCNHNVLLFDIIREVASTGRTNTIGEDPSEAGSSNK